MMYRLLQLLGTIVLPNACSDASIIMKDRRKYDIPLVGIHSIDHDHLETLRLLKEVLTGKDYVQDVVKALQHTWRHFESEEASMAQIKYPYMKIHKLEHESLRGAILAFLKPSLITQDDRIVAIDECKRMLRYHVYHHDLQLALFLKEESHA